MSEQYVTFTLAHPLRTEDAESLGIEPRIYNVREQLTLLRRDAERLAGAGLVLGADTNHRATWAAALKPVKSTPATATKPATGKAE
ncbi:hypothetical protein ACFOY2_45790 [Nonomuraea purpurea]|uniref:Uncharacterized protein n=1 Tax=Nonomuraea purpurea TaxID=1849276 RepID=A0ABV8GNR9_9ACTN